MESGETELEEQMEQKEAVENELQETSEYVLLSCTSSDSRL